MFKKTVLLICFIMAVNIFADDKDKKSKQKTSLPNLKEGEFFLSLAETGIGAGYRIRYTSDEVNYKCFTIQLNEAKDPNEIMYYDMWGYPHKIRDYITILMPITVGLQKRLGVESIEDNLRPFINADIGPILGWGIPTGQGFSGNISRSKVNVTIGGMIGIGFEYVQKDAPIVILSAGYRVSYFLKRLSERKKFNSFFIKVGIAKAY